MNFQQRDEELIRRQLEAQAAALAMQAQNAGNVGYSQQGLDDLMSGNYQQNRVPELKPTQPVVKQETRKQERQEQEQRKPTYYAPNYNTQKPSTRYENKNVVQNKPKQSSRDTSYDADLDNFFNYRVGDFSGEVDYDPVNDMDVESWRNVKKDIMAKNKWSEEEFEKRWKDYYQERSQKTADEEVQTAAKVAKDNALLGTALQAIYTPQNMVEGAAAMLSNLMPDKYKAQSADDTLFTGTRAKEAAKQTVKDEHIKTGIGKGLYDMGTSLGDMVLASGIPVLGAASLGTQAAARSNMNALERGVDPNKAAKTGAASGVISGIMNKVGLDKALGAAGKTALGTVGKAAVREGAENVLEDVANYGVDQAINKNKSQLGSMHDYYVSQGMDDNQAWGQVAKDTGIDLVKSFGSGAAFGGLMSGAQNIPALTAEIGGKLNKIDNRGGVDVQGLAEANAEVAREAAERQQQAADILKNLQEQIPKTESAPVEQGFNDGQLSPEEVRVLQDVVNGKYDIPENGNETPGNIKIPEYTAKEDVYFRGSDADIAQAESQDKAIVDTFKNIITDPEFNALSFKNGSKEVFVSPATNGNGLRMSYTIDGVPTGHHDYSLDQVDDLSRNLRNEAGNGGEDIKIQRKSDFAKKTPSNPRAVQPLAGTELEQANARLNELKNAISAKKLEAEAAKERWQSASKKNKNAAYQEWQARKGELSDLQGEQRSLKRAKNGEATPVKEVMQKENTALYDRIYGRNSGLMDKLNYAARYAGNTPEAKQLASDIKASLKQYIETGDAENTIFSRDITTKINQLDDLARNTNAEYASTHFDDVFYGDDGASIWNELLGDTNNTGIIDDIHRYYQNVRRTKPAEAPTENVDRALTPDEVQRLEEGLAEGERQANAGLPREYDIATRYAQAFRDFDTYDYDDATFQGSDGIDKMADDIAKGRDLSQYIEALDNMIDEAPDADTQANMQSLRDELSTINEGRVTEPQNQLPTVVQQERTQNSDMPHMNGMLPSDVPPTDVGKVNDLGNGKNTKTSETYTNTGKRGRGWTEEEYAKYTDPSQFQYETVSEQESVSRAADMLQNEGIDEFKDRVMNKERLTGAEIDGLMMEWRILGEQARQLEAAGEDAKDAWKESVRVFRKIQEQSTSNAQALQVLAKWSRNTPEGMLAEAENIINGKQKAKGPGKSEIQKTFEKFSKQNKKFKFSDDFAIDFQKKAAELTGLDPESRQAKELMAELGKMINRQVPSSIGEKAMSFLMNNMLGNFRTLIARNAGGNLGLNAVEQVAQRPLAAGIDTLLSKKTGRRTQAGLSKEGLSEYLSGFAKGLKEEASDFRKDLHTARSGENTLANAISSNRHVWKEKGIMDRLDKLVRHGLSVGDRPFYEAVYKQTMGDYQRLRDKGQMGDVIQSLSDEDFKNYSETAAKLNALSAVYQQDSKMAKALLDFKGAVGGLSEGILGFDILSQFSMPFVRTPANVVERAIDYSPLGFVRNTARTISEKKNGGFDQNRFANETARNILGTGLMAGGAALAANGGMSGSYSEDKNRKQAQKEAGEQEYAWNVPKGVPFIGGKQMDISWAPVVGSNLVAAAAAQDAYNKGDGNTIGDIAKGVQAGGQALFDQSMFQGLQRLFGTGESYNSDEGIVANMGNVVKSGLGQLIPSLARQAGQVKDPYQRDVAYSNKDTSFGPMDNYDINSLANNIPGLRENVLAPKVNTSGELIKENQGRGTGMKILEDMILPGKLTDVNYSRLSEEANRLSELTTNEDSYMPKADRKLVDTEDHTLTNQEWTDYQQKYYGELTKAGESLLDSDFYKDASPELQESSLKNVYSSIRSAINSEYNGKEVTGDAKLYLDAGGGEKGIEAVVKRAENRAKAAELGIDKVDTYEKKEAEYPGGAAQWVKDKAAVDEVNAKYGTKYDTEDFQKYKTKEALIENAQKKEEAKDAGFVKKDGSVNLQGYEKLLKQAGDKADKVIEAIPTLEKMGLEKSAQYTYANALKEIPSLTPDSFARTYKQIDGADGSKPNQGIKQDEILAYLNKGNYTNNQAQQLWYAYGSRDWKQVPVYNGKTWKKGKKK